MLGCQSLFLENAIQPTTAGIIIIKCVALKREEEKFNQIGVSERRDCIGLYTWTDQKLMVFLQVWLNPGAQMSSYEFDLCPSLNSDLHCA